ncbi:ComEA family DNA-binding protein [Paenibacillus ginsengarvi]|uniref:Helix-hairpin-helix domain-containing protein n=1 Tax=Paenibacillus ginsengarvi TaxID=400777 RepID=A0A3B0BZF3_9BACL|nr:helix-hairpin-helix domain-containing protein [Paenibacillus ginsengarvi]RKN79035.1 helix-hairpin-helix domain-containing protein [Paenibacillus ginsengarvi]
MNVKTRHRWVAAAIWGATALLLWAISGLLHGGVSGSARTGEGWIVRNADLAALFTGQEPPKSEKTSATAATPQSPQPSPKPPTAAKSAAGAAGVSGSATGVVEPKSQKAAAGVLDLNRASESELDKLPGIGPSKAKAIAEYRSREGPFRTVEDLKKVKGIGDKTFETLKPYITVDP